MKPNRLLALLLALVMALSLIACGGGTTSTEEVVEVQQEDVPRDMACYKDANGNTYDFAFGLNWSGVINDTRVQTYSKAPISKVTNFDYSAYESANK